MKIDYDQVKFIINNLNNLNNNNKDINNYSKIEQLVIKLCLEHNYLFLSTINLYKSNFYSYYRFFYIFYILVKYVYFNLSEGITKDEVKYIFEIFIRYTRKYKISKYDYKTIEKDRKNILNEFEHLYETFFINKNLYFSVYFNNLIKYFLPLPFELNVYSPLITYRKNVDRIFKKNSIDYYDKIQPIDTINTHRKVDKNQRNIGMINKEIDIHLPTNLINDKLYPSDVIFCIGLKEELLLCNSLNRENNKITVKLLYIRKKVEMPIIQHKKGFPFEKLNNIWNKTNETKTFNLDEIVYLSVMKKITEKDLFNVFNKINFEKTLIKEMYHYTGLDINKSKLEEMLKCPSFFSPTPIFYNQNHIYYKGKRCLFYKTLKDINNLIDLTRNITVDNPFNKYDNIKSVFYDFSKMEDYYKNKDIPIVEDKRYMCLSTSEIFNKKNYCDVNTSKHYVGRRKLQEILYKTRKYMHQDIWIADYDISKKIKSNVFHENIYHPMSKDKCKMYSYNYDAVILSNLNIVGFWFTDYVDRFNTGGEIFLSYPFDYLKLIEYSKEKCFDKKLNRIKFN